jgi:hypothetical protein
MRLVQFVSANGERRVGRVSDDGRNVQVLSGVGTTYELARRAVREGRALEDLAAAAGNSEIVDLADLLTDGRVLAPLDHPDPAHCLVTGTGLTHWAAPRRATPCIRRCSRTRPSSATR